MAKEWILNSAMNRFQLNFKRNVGATSESIRKCAPQSLQEWREYYFSNVKSQEHIAELGKKLYVKITEVLCAEIEEITEQDCVDYMIGLVIDRTYDGYKREIKTVYGQLQELLNHPIQPSSDQWDRSYNVDFFIEIKGKFIGLQIKPVNQGIPLAQIFKEKNLQSSSHQEFEKKHGGKVFYIFSSSVRGEKIIRNEDVVGEIQAEIERLDKS